MGMEGVGFGLAIVSEIRATAKSVKERYECYKQAPALFENVDGALTRVSESFDEIQSILLDNLETLPKQTRGLFLRNQNRVNEALFRLREMFERFEALDFDGSRHVDVEQSTRQKVKRVLRAKSLDTGMKDIEKELSNIELILHHQLSRLTATIKMDHVQGSIVMAAESYRAGNMIPSRPDNLYVDYAQDENGKFYSPEGKLKSTLMSSTSSNSVIAAGGTAMSGVPVSGVVHGASGMAGVGKTTSLIALAHDEEILSHFRDGILYLTLGADATVTTITDNLSDMMQFTGASVSAEAVRNEADLKKAVKASALWFQGKCNLFLMDDVWPTATCNLGYIPELREILTGSPCSRVVLSTRNRNIVSAIGSYVDFGARDVHGPISRSIFMRSASNGCHAPVGDGDDLPTAVQDILSLCAGLPIALAVTGGCVASRVSAGLGFEFACNSYLQDLRENMNICASVLENAISLSLSYLDSELGKISDLSSGYSMYEMYESLCVLEKKELIPTAVLAKMWGVDDRSAERIAILFSSMNLGNVSIQRNFAQELETGLRVHDLHQDFCREQAQRKCAKKKWHFRLLKGHMPFLKFSTRNDVDFDRSLREILHHSPEEWYSEDLINKKYMKQNLTRHLFEAGLIGELWAIVLDPTWMHAQVNYRGRPAIKNDIMVLEKSARVCLLAGESCDAVKSVRTISRSLEGIHPESLSSVEALTFSLLCRIGEECRENDVFRNIRSKIISSTPKPCLLPVTSDYFVADEALVHNINVGAQCVDYSPCGRHLVAGAGSDVVVLNSETRGITKRLNFHKDRIQDVKFVSSSSMILSASSDCSITLWQWESNEIPSMVLAGHTDKVMDIALGIDDTRIFSASMDGTVKIWDMRSGNCLKTIIVSGGARELALCGHTIAILTERAGLCIRDIQSCRMGSWLRFLNPFGRMNNRCSKSWINDANITAIASSKNAQHLALGFQDGHIEVRQAINWTQAYNPLTGHTTAVSSLSFSPNSPRLVSSSVGGSICAWNMDNGDLCGRVYINQHVQNINFSPDGQRVVSNAGDCSIRICDFNLLQNAGIAVAERGEEFTQLFALSSDGERVLELTHSSKLVLHNALNGDRISEFGAPDGVACIAIDHCGHQVSFGNEIGEIRVWGTETSSKTRKCWAAHSDRVISISFSIDGTKIVSAGKDGFIRVCDVSRERQIGCIAEDHFENVAFSDDGDFVISSEAGAFHSEVKMWKWDTEELGYHSSDPVACPQGLSEEDALNVLQGCGPKSSMLWPISRERYPGDVFVERPEYCTLYFVPRKDTEGLNSGEKKFLAYLPCDSKWEFSRLQGTFVTAANRRLLICRLVQ